MMSPMASRARWEIPADVVSRWMGLHGDDVVRRWLADAQVLAASCEEAWRLHIEGFLPGGSLSCVLACRGADSPVVLKLLAPWAESIGTEALALAAWDGHGAVALLERTPDGRALLLSRVSPGCAFSPSGSDELDCERVAGTLRVLASVPVPDALPALSDAVRARFARARGMAAQPQSWITAQDLEDAEQRAVALARSARDRGLVHGDAQDKNLLLSDPGGTLVAIDPEPSAGDRHFDPALWALTHRPGAGVRERCAALAGLLELDGTRLWEWCLVLAVAEVALEVEDRARAHHAFLAQASRELGGWVNGLARSGGDGLADRRHVVDDDRGAGV
jgi:streptomycin 6-kinase